MNRLLIFCLLINLISLNAQELKEPQDSLTMPLPKTGITIVADVFSPVYGLFSDKKGFRASLYVPLAQKWQILAAGGIEENRFDDIGWESNQSGFFAELGSLFFLSQDKKSPDMGYYIGGKLGYSSYKQTVDNYLIQGTDIDPISGSLPEHNASAVWLTPLVGGRAQLGTSNFYADVNVGINILISETNDYKIDALSIPGFGKNNNGLNLGVYWGIGYVF